MQAFLLGLAKSLMTEWLVKRLASSKNELDDQAVFLVGQALDLEDKDDEYEAD